MDEQYPDGPGIMYCVLCRLIHGGNNVIVDPTIIAQPLGQRPHNSIGTHSGGCFGSQEELSSPFRSCFSQCAQSFPRPSASSFSWCGNGGWLQIFKQGNLLEIIECIFSCFSSWGYSICWPLPLPICNRRVGTLSGRGAQVVARHISLPRQSRRGD